MPLATNDAGDTLYLDEMGQWVHAPQAHNPQTNELYVYDGKNWVQPPKPQSIGRIADDVVRSLASGATFGFADELSAAMSPGSYAENLKREQARDKEIPSSVRIPGEVAGGIGASLAAAPFVGAGAAATGLSKLPQWARLAGIGATSGGLYGAGSAEPGKRIEGAAMGAAIGAPMGYLAPLALRGGARAAQAIGRAFQPQAKATAELGRAMMRDEDTPLTIGRKAAALASERPGTLILPDVGGENVRGLVERVANTPGAGRTKVAPFLTQRQQGQANRVAADLVGLTGAHQTAKQTIDATMAARAAAAKPAYEAAYQNGDKAIWSPELERLSSAPAVQSAMRKAVTAWRNNAVADGYGAMNPGAVVENGGNLKFLQGKVPVFPNIQFWDYTKRMLDDQVQAAYKAGQNQKGNALRDITRALRKELDNSVPEYAEARKAWEGPSRYLGAIEEGRDITSNKVSAEELASRLSEMTDAEKEAYRIGAVSSIVGKMRSDPAKLGDMTKYLRSPEMRDKVASIMPTLEAAEKWAKRLDFEIGSSELTGRALGNSATARRIAERQDAESIAGDIVIDALAGSPVSSLWRRVVMAGPKKVRDTLRSRTDQKLAGMLTGPQSLDDLARLLEQASQRQPVSLSNAAQGASAVGVQPLLQPLLTPSNF